MLTFKFITRNVQRGFVCDDPSLSLERRPDTISNLMLVLWGASPLLIVIYFDSQLNAKWHKFSFWCFQFLILEFLIERNNYENHQIAVRRAWRNSAFLSHRYLLNMLCMHIVTMSVKMFAVAHRPHFFETCKPDTMENCTQGTFVSSYTCTNEQARIYDFYDASWSFFSGHAATCVYSCLFVSW